MTRTTMQDAPFRKANLDPKPAPEPASTTAGSELVFRADWGTSQTAQLAWNPRRPIRAIALGPNDTSGGVLISTPATPVVMRVARGAPLVLDLGEQPITISQMWGYMPITCNLELIVYYELPSYVPLSRAPLIIDFDVNVSTVRIPVAGRRRIVVQGLNSGTLNPVAVNACSEGGAGSLSNLSMPVFSESVAANGSFCVELNPSSSTPGDVNSRVITACQFLSITTSSANAHFHVEAWDE